VVLGAVYLLWMIERVFFGKVLQERNQHIPDLNRRELAVFLPLVAIIFWMGLYPKPFIDKMEPTVDKWLQQVENGAAKTVELPPGLGSP